MCEICRQFEGTFCFEMSFGVAVYGRRKKKAAVRREVYTTDSPFVNI